MTATAPIRRTPADISALVAAELATFGDDRLRASLTRCLVSPRSHMRVWEWSRPPGQFECWLVAESQKYDYGIIYCEFGFGPSSPWGLTFLSKDNIGADYCWYPRLEDVRINVADVALATQAGHGRAFDVMHCPAGSKTPSR